MRLFVEIIYLYHSFTDQQVQSKINHTYFYKIPDRKKKKDSRGQDCVTHPVSSARHGVWHVVTTQDMFFE